MSINKPLYFIRTFDPSLCNAEGDIIALLPDICYQLDKKRKKYHIPEDFYSFQERKDYAHGYYKRLSRWIDSLDDYIKGSEDDPIIKKTPFARLYGYRIFTLMDLLLVCKKNIDAALSAVNPTEVHLIIDESSAGSYGTDHILFSPRQEPYSLLLPLICKERTIPYVVHFAKDEAAVPMAESFNTKSYIKDTFLHFKKGIKRELKQIRDNYVYKLFVFKNTEKGAILLHDNGWLGNIRKGLIRSGWRIYPPIAYDNTLSISPDSCGIKKMWEKISDDCMKHFVPSRWINEESGSDLSGIFNERLEYFLKRICPFMHQEIIKYSRVIDEKKIRLIVCPFKIHPTDISIMAVAGSKKEVLSVQVEHGNGEGVDDLWLFAEQPTKMYIPCSAGDGECLDVLFNQENKMQTRIVHAVTWTERYKKEYYKRKGRPAGSKSRKKIYYLPGAVVAQRFNSPYPLSWYYRLQCDLITYFAKQTQFDFIIKTAPTVPWFNEPLTRFVEETRFENIFFKQGDLVRSLRFADKVITDYPSSPTFEARLMGLPVLSLYHAYKHINHPDIIRFGKTMAPFRSFEDIRKAIDDFLAAPGEAYVVPMDNEFSWPRFIDAIES